MNTPCVFGCEYELWIVDFGLLDLVGSSLDADCACAELRIKLKAGRETMVRGTQIPH